VQTGHRFTVIGLLGGPLLAVILYTMLPDVYTLSDGSTAILTTAGKATAAIGIWMALWWMTEAIPIYATALLPLLLFPLTGAASAKAAAAPYGHHLIYLFLGGFIIAQAMERWDLHRRIALKTLQHVGTAPTAIIGGFMGITAALSMWVSNTATAMMMLPIALSVSHWMRQNQSDAQAGKFEPALLLGVAYAASIGGMGTLIGTPPNLFLASFLKSQGVEISFIRWMAVGLPVVFIMLPLSWLLLTRILFKCGRHPLASGRILCQDAYKSLGPFSKGERNTLIVFILTALLWITRPLLNRMTLGAMQPLSGLTDSGIAILGALLLFLLPVDRQTGLQTMDWERARKLPWGVLLLFGGGLSLAAALQANGVSAFLGTRVSSMADAPVILIILLVTALMIFLTELTSNTASTVTFVPLLYAAAAGLGLHPLALIVPAALAASCAFMLPVATPPNAIVFGSGKIEMAQMIRAGLWLNLIGIIIITLLGYGIVVRLLG